MKKFGIPTLVCVIFLFIGIAFSKLPGVINTDTLYDIRAGQIYATQGLLTHDIFSYTENGKMWYPYEWLAQISISTVTNLLGYQSLLLFATFLFLLNILLFYGFLRHLWKLPWYSTLGITLLYIALTFEFFLLKPQVFGLLFFITTFFICLRYYLLHKNLLLLLLPITCAWANSHGSIIFDLYLLGSFTCLSFFQFIRKREIMWRRKTIVFAMIFISSSILTILPPIGITQYTLIFYFSHHTTALSQYVSEWQPIYHDPLVFSIYICCLAITAGTIFICRKSLSLWWIICLPFIILPFLATRNLFYCYFSLCIIMASAISTEKNVKKGILFMVGIIYIFSGILFLLKYSTKQTFDFYSPQAVSFIQTNHFKGHIFNDVTYGSYILYRLYPQQKVFIDTRGDVYLCCEIPLFLDLSNNTLSWKDVEKKYALSFVVINTRQTLMLQIGHILSHDPSWVLVYWDDLSQIFVKKDGLNDGIIQQFGTKAVTLYESTPYKKGMEEQAIQEYLRMIAITDSAKSENTLGLLFLQKSQIDVAKHHFEKAIHLNSDFIPPYLNLATINISEKDYATAIQQYETVENIQPTTVEPYIYEGEVYNTFYHNYVKAKEIWQQGLQNVTDEQGKKQLQELINAQ